MGKTGYLGLLFGLTVLSVPTVGLAQAQSTPAPTINPDRTQAKTVVARIWHGKTPTAKADEYYTYLLEAGIKKIESIPGNLGAQVLRRTDGKVTEFTVISYWESREAIRKFAGDDIEKVRPLPRDNEYLIDPESKVKHFDVLRDDRR